MFAASIPTQNNLQIRRRICAKNVRTGEANQARSTYVNKSSFCLSHRTKKETVDDIVRSS